MYRLYAFFTQNSLKALYTLEEVGAEYEFRYVDLMKGENRSEAFRAMTPVGKVPVLEHGGRYLFESGAICRYVANNEQSELYPQDAYERAQVDQWMDYFTCHAGRWLTSLYFQNIIKPKAGLGDPDPAAIEEATIFSHQSMKVLERWLSSHEWLANNRFSIAEPFALAYMEQVRMVNFSLHDYPGVAEWFDRLDSRETAARARAHVAPKAAAIV